jgi:exonuclease III
MLVIIASFNIQNLVIINVYIHQGQRIGSTAYNNKLQYLASLAAHITMLQQQNYIVTFEYYA